MTNSKTISLFSDNKVNADTLEKIDQCIQITLGPNGKSAIQATKKNEIKFLTNGSLLIKALDFPFHSANLLIKLLEQAATKTNSVAGDGSTLTLLFACQLLKLSFRCLVSGYNLIFLNNGFKKISYFFMEKIVEFSIPICLPSEVFGILKTCLGKKVSPQIVLLLEKAIFKMGRDGLIVVEENLGLQNEIELVQGIELDRGFASSYFVNDLKNFEVNYENPFLLIAQTPIVTLNQIREVIDFVKENNKALVIIVEEINKDVLSSLVLNTIQKKIRVTVVKYNSIKLFKNGILEDLALLTYSNSFEPKLQASNTTFSIQDLGQAKKVIIKKEKTTFFVSKFAKVLVTRRINELNRELLVSDSEYEKAIFKTRIARLSGQIVKIKLANSNEYELEELKTKVEKSIQTMKSALEEGFLAGGASFFLVLRDELNSWAYLNLIGEEMIASFIVTNVLERPRQQLFLNSEFSSQQIIEQLNFLGYPYTYDFLEKQIVNTLEKGLVDSSKSIRSILWNSMTIVCSILTSY